MHLSDWLERVDLGEEIQEVYLHSFLFKLAVNLIAIFLPLYVLELGFGPVTVFTFFFAYYATYVFFSWPSAFVASRIGYKHTSLLASPVILGFYLLLRTVDHSWLTLHLVGLLGGIGFNLYWAGMNPEMAESSHSEERDAETGLFFSMPTLGSMLSPFVGGLILAVYDFNLLLLTAAVLVGASFLPFLFSREHREGMAVSPRLFYSWSHVYDFLTYVGKGVNSIGKKVLWPLYLAVVIKGSVSIGGAGSLLALGGAVTSIVLGKYVDDDNRGRVIVVAAFLTAASFLLMSQATSSLHAFELSLWNGLSYTALSIPIYSRAMDNAEREDYVEYFAFRETGLAVGRLATLAALFAVFTVLPSSIHYLAGFGFVAAGVMTVGYTARRL